jgi:hypothetical protein
MSPAEAREEYYRHAAARSAALSDFFSILRDQLALLAAKSGRIDLLANRNAALAALTGYRALEEESGKIIAAKLADPAPLMERLLACRRRLAAAVGERLFSLLDSSIPHDYPARGNCGLTVRGGLLPPRGQ